MSALETDKNQESQKCPCKKKNCPRYRNCEACKAYHSNSKRPPYCMREKSLSFRLFGF